MEKRVQVFVSSTFVDLVDERQAVVQTLLKLNAFPAGMELFPASDDDKWELIKGVIDDSDYYCLILGGRYGSEDNQTQLSYTEMEYDHAQETGKPTMVFMHRNPDAIPQGLTDKDPTKAKKLTDFREKVGGARNAQFFENAHELAAGVAVSLTDMVRKRPAIGWVRGDSALTPELRGELIELRASAAATAKSGTEPVFPDLEDGEDRFDYDVKFTYADPKGEYYSATEEVSATWNAIFGGIAVRFLHESPEQRISNALGSLLKAIAKEIIYENDGSEDVEKIMDLSITTPDVFEDVLVQLLALRLIQRGTEKRAVSDRQRYWRLTERGEDRMMQLKARRRSSAPPVGVPS